MRIADLCTIRCSLRGAGTGMRLVPAGGAGPRVPGTWRDTAAATAAAAAEHAWFAPKGGRANRLQGGRAHAAPASSGSRRRVQLQQLLWRGARAHWSACPVNAPEPVLGPSPSSRRVAGGFSRAWPVGVGKGTGLRCPSACPGVRSLHLAGHAEASGRRSRLLQEQHTTPTLLSRVGTLQGLISAAG